MHNCVKRKLRYCSSDNMFPSHMQPLTDVKVQLVKNSLEEPILFILSNMEKEGGTQGSREGKR